MALGWGRRGDLGAHRRAGGGAAGEAGGNLEALEPKLIAFSSHALDQMPVRGATVEEGEEAIRSGEQVPAKEGRQAYRKNFPFRGLWKGRYYETKQVMPIVVEEPERLVVVTVYVFYFGGRT